MKAFQVSRNVLINKICSIKQSYIMHLEFTQTHFDINISQKGKRNYLLQCNESCA